MKKQAENLKLTIQQHNVLQILSTAGVVVKRIDRFETIDLFRVNDQTATLGSREWVRKLSIPTFDNLFQRGLIERDWTRHPFIGYTLTLKGLEALAKWIPPAYPF